MQFAVKIFVLLSLAFFAEGDVRSAEDVRRSAVEMRAKHQVLQRPPEQRAWPTSQKAQALPNDLGLKLNVPASWVQVGVSSITPQKDQQSWVFRVENGVEVKVTAFARASSRSPVLNEWWTLHLPLREFGLDSQLEAWRSLSDWSFADLVVRSRFWLCEGTPELEQRQAVLLNQFFSGETPWGIQYQSTGKCALVGLRAVPPKHRGKTAQIAYLTIYDLTSGTALLTFSIATKDPFADEVMLLKLVEGMLGEPLD